MARIIKKTYTHHAPEILRQMLPSAFRTRLEYLRGLTRLTTISPHIPVVIIDQDGNDAQFAASEELKSAMRIQMAYELARKYQPMTQKQLGELAPEQLRARLTILQDMKLTKHIKKPNGMLGELALLMEINSRGK